MTLLSALKTWLKSLNFSPQRNPQLLFNFLLAMMNSRSDLNCQQKQSSPKKLKLSNGLNEEEKLYLFTNCRLFSPVYLDSLNVLFTSSIEDDLDSKFESFSNEIFSPCWASNENLSQSPVASLLSFVEMINFFDGFQDTKEISWMKFLSFKDIIPQIAQQEQENLQKFIESFYFDEDSIELNFQGIESNLEAFSLLICNFFRFLANFSLKRLAIRNYSVSKNEFQDLVFFLAGNRFSLDHLEFERINFDKCEEFKERIFFPNLTAIIINQCQGFHKLGIEIGTKFISFKSTSKSLHFSHENENIFSFSDKSPTSSDYSKAYENSIFVSFLTKNPQLENLIYTNSFKPTVNKEIQKAIFSLTNLKILNVPLRSPFENYLGCKCIEHLAVHKPTYDIELKWNNLVKFPCLKSLGIHYSAYPYYGLFDYLRLDTLEYLTLQNCEFNQQVEEEFFQIIYNLKNLKALSAPIQRTKRIVLGDSIECAFLDFKGIKCSSEYSGQSYSQYVIEEFSSLLPKATNIKYLQIHSTFNAENLTFPGCLKDEKFPKLEILRNLTCMSFKTNEFLIVKDSAKFSCFQAFDFIQDSI